MYEIQAKYFHGNYEELCNNCQQKYRVNLILYQSEILMHLEVMGTEISKAEKHLCQGSKRCVDLMGLCLIFTNNWWLGMYLSLQAKFLPINLADWIITYNIIYTKSLEFGNVKWTVSYCLVSTCESSCYSNIFVIFPVDTRRCFNVYKTSIRRRDVV